MKSFLFSVLRITLLSYFGLIIVYGVFQREFLYYPEVTHFSSFEECPFFSNEEKRKTSNGSSFFYKGEKTQPLVVFYHGNAGTACDRFELLDLLRDNGYAVLFPEYPGYASDTKKTTQKEVLRMAYDIELFIKSTTHPEIILMGRSLGSSVAAFHSTISPSKKLILISPFPTIKDVAAHHYPMFPHQLQLIDNYETIRYLTSFDGRLTLIYGKNDEVVPSILSQKLYTSLKNEQKVQIILENSHHNDLNQAGLFEIIKTTLKN